MPEVNYGLAAHGNDDAKGELLPLRLHLERRDEPDYSHEDHRHQKPVEMHGTLAASSLTPGQRYVLIRFTRLEDVPVSGFLRAAKVVGAKRTSFVAPKGGRFETPVHFMSDSTISFRCVRDPE